VFLAAVYVVTWQLKECKCLREGKRKGRRGEGKESFGDKAFES